MIAGVEAEQIRVAVRGFKAVEHRLEYVATVRGVEYYNDSKATNVDATIKALESFPGGIHLILGGKDKGSDYSVLNSAAEGAGEAGVHDRRGGGEDRSPGRAELEIVKRGRWRPRSAGQRGCAAGDIVLLAPACASFDQFQSYEHRGRVFKGLVQALPARTQERDRRQQPPECSE